MAATTAWRSARGTSSPARRARRSCRRASDLKAPPLADLAALDDAAFRALFPGSPVKRIGRDRFVRNVLIAIGNSGDHALTGSAVPHLRDPDPLVRGTAVWALSRLAERTELLSMHASLPPETDGGVAQEWRLALEGLKRVEKQA